MEEYRFGDFRFAPAERRLERSGDPVDLSSRYLDVLALMVARPGQLVTKELFMDSVWSGVPVTDEALTQAIRVLRKALGDDAANPRFIETVPKHGYRFVAPLDESVDDRSRWEAPAPRLVPFVIAGAAGGALAGLLGGLAYALSGGGAMQLVLVGLTAMLAMLGGGGIAAGVAVARRLAPRGLSTDLVGGMVGGLVVGSMARLFAIDTFTLLFGAAPHAMTGASEGLLLGAATGAALACGPRLAPIVRGAAIGGLAGIFIALMGGRLMAGSLALLDSTFSDSALGLPFLALFARSDMAAIAAQAAIAAAEGALFVGLLAAALSRVRA